MSDRREEFNVGADPELDLRLASGSITLRANSESQVVVEVRGPRAADFVIEQREDKITVHQPRSTGLRWRGHHLDISAPAGTAVDADTASADLVSTVAVGRVSVKSASGGIQLSRADGGRLDSASGDIDVRSAANDLRVKSASGTITLGEVATFNASTSSGDVMVQTALGPANASTASGDVSIGRAAGEIVTTKTVSGNISVAVPTGRSVDVDIKSLSGTVSLPSEPGASSSERGPDISLRARSVSGNVEVLTSP